MRATEAKAGKARGRREERKRIAAVGGSVATSVLVAGGEKPTYLTSE